MSDLYVDLINRLRTDAAGAISALLQARQEEDAPVAPGEILVRQHGGREHWFARVNRPGWFAGYTGDTSRSEVEALCALIERARQDVEDTGRMPAFAPPHLLDRLDNATERLGVYRWLAARMLTGALAGALDALERLDVVAEASGWDAEIVALAQLRDAARARRLRDQIRRDVSRYGEAGGGEEEGRKLFESRVDVSLHHLWSESPGGGA